MPVEFLSDDQAASFGRFSGVPSRRELEQSAWFDDADRAVIVRHRGDGNRLGFATQLATVRMVGTFLVDPLDVPWAVVTFLAGQLGIADPSVVKSYAAREKTLYEHQWEIIERFGFQPWGALAVQGELRSFLSARAWTSAEGPTRLFERATVWLRGHKVLLPGASVLARLVSEVRTEQAERLYRTISDAVPGSVRPSLLELLDVAPGSRVSELERLRTGPTRVSVPEMLRQVQRLNQLQELGVNGFDLSALPVGRLNLLARHGMAGKASALRELAEPRRTATVIATMAILTADVADDLCDALDLIIAERVVRKATRESTAARLRAYPRLSRASAQLAQAAQVIVEVMTTDAGSQDMQAELASRLSVSQLTEAIAVVGELVHRDGTDGEVATEMMRRYATVRSFLPALADAAPFGATAGGAPVLTALAGVSSLLGRRRLDADDIYVDLLSPAWKRLVLEGDTPVDRRAYILAVTDALHRALRRRDVFVTAGRRWGDPRTRLLADDTWATVKDEVLTGLQLTEDPDTDVGRAAARLDSTYRLVAAQIPTNEGVRIDSAGKVHLSPLDALAVPASLTRLRSVTSAMLPRIDLPEVLLEVNSWTGFLTEFRHVSQASARMEDLDVSVAAVLIAEACNVGLTPVVSESTPALTRGRLSHVDQNYIRADTLQAANARLIEAQAEIGLAQRWGGGLLASADGMRFVVPVATVNAGANPRYFGRGRGVTWLNYLNDQVSGLGAVVVPGTVRDSLHILDGLLNLDGGQRPEMVTTDTASYSDQIFGLFALLGYRFSPRLADLPDQRFWRIDASATYGALDAVAGRNQINVALISANWPDMLRLAGSLATGAVRASEILRVTQGGGSPTLLGRAVAEYGRIAKTQHLLAFIDVDETYRRQIHTQLAMQESRHALARLIFHGRRGQIRQAYREGQEDQLGALGLALNAVALWNTRYLDAAVTHLERGGTEPAADEDVQRLSPLGSEHINMLGRYTFGAALPQKRLRPLRDPTTTD